MPDSQYIGFSKEDRDLLVTLNVKVNNLIGDVKDIRDDTKQTVADHENRLRFIERYMWLVIGACFIVQFIIQIYLKL